MPDPATLALLILAAFFAAFVDAIVGGGGIITLPALLATGMPPHVALGTNKLVGTSASSTATWQYLRAGVVQPKDLLRYAPWAAGGSAIGVLVVVRLPEQAILVFVVAAIAAMTTYVLVRPRFGSVARDPIRHGPLVATGAALVIGAYDGFLGPGTGAILIFALVAILGLDFLHAAALGRGLNFASNVAALVVFAALGLIDYAVGLIMVPAMVAGAFVGSRVGIRAGATWVKTLFVVVSLALMAKIAWDLV